jgi:hypothetical protein
MELIKKYRPEICRERELMVEFFLKISYKFSKKKAYENCNLSEEKKTCRKTTNFDPH